MTHYLHTISGHKRKGGGGGKYSKGVHLLTWITVTQTLNLFLYSKTIITDYCNIFNTACLSQVVQNSTEKYPMLLENA